MSALDISLSVTGLSGLGLVLFAITELLGAAWTWSALRG